MPLGQHLLHRRRFLNDFSTGLGTIALTSLLSDDLTFGRDPQSPGSILNDEKDADPPGCGSWQSVRRTQAAL